MKIFKFTKEIENKEILNLVDEKSFFFDIETTGFSRSYCTIYMIGTGKIIGDKFFVKQFFAENKDKEKEIIEAFLDELQDDYTLISFNGEAFDLPFLESRSKAFGIDFKKNYVKSLDIYKKLKKLNYLFNFSSLKQKSIEEFLEIERDDRYDGGKLIEVYKSYELMPSDENEYLLMIHNREDVIGMIDLISMLFYEKIPTIALSYKESFIKNDNMYFSFKTDLYVPKSLRIESDSITLFLEPFLVHGVLRTNDKKVRYYFNNYKDYVYLVEDKKIIPKILVSHIDKNKYRCPKKSECYTLIDIEKISKDILLSFVQNILHREKETK